MLNPRAIVPMRQDATIALFIDAIAYERMDKVANLASRCTSGDVAPFVDAVGTACFKFAR